jgi:Alpha-L-rhamnosidase N-terminal domain
MKKSVTYPFTTIWMAMIGVLCVLSQAGAQKQKRTMTTANSGTAVPTVAIRDYPSPPLTPSWVWIVPSNKDKAISSVGCFRKVITLKGMPHQVVAWISADRRYRLWINGRRVSQGPADPGEDYPGGKSQVQSGLYYCDYRNLTPFFHSGVNVIAVEVFAERMSSWYGSTDHPGLLFQAQITAADHSVSTLQADESWRSLAANYLRNAERGVNYYAAEEPVRSRRCVKQSIRSRIWCE